MPSFNWNRMLRRLSTLFGVVMLAGAIYVLQREIRGISYADLRASLEAIPRRALFFAGMSTVAAYAILSFYDWLACRHICLKQSFRRAAFAAFCSYVLSHNLGFAALSGAAVRFRLYRKWGLTPFQIAQVIAFCSTTYLLGALALIGGIFLLEPGGIPLLDKLPPFALRVIGGGGWLIVAVYVGLSVHFRKLTIGRFEVEVPRLPIALAQVMVSVADMAATAAIAYCLLPEGASLSYPTFLAIYVASYTAGLVASVPGGLGIFDGSMLLALSPFIATSQILGILVVFRLFYYIIPLIFAGVMFAGHELFLRGDAVWARKRGAVSELDQSERRPSLAIRESEADFSVTVATGVVAGIGIFLVFFTAAAEPNIASLAYSYWLLQSAQVVLCLIGVSLVGLAVGLAQRVTVAWKLSIFLLFLALPLAVISGTPLWIPLLLMLVIFLIAPFRACYYRRSRLFGEPLSPSLIAPVIIWLISLCSIFFVTVAHPPRDVWLRTLLVDARYARIRLALGGACLITLWALVQMIRRSRVKVFRWDDEHEALYRSLSHALTQFGGRVPHGMLVNESRMAAIPFFRTSNLIVGLGDPAGEERESTFAIWRLRDLAREEGRRPVFIHISQALTNVYAGLGMTIFPSTIDELQGVSCYAQDYVTVMALLGDGKGSRSEHVYFRNFFHVETRASEK